MKHASDTSSARILITGGGGFVGSYLVQELTAVERQEVVVFDRNPERIRIDNFKNYATDIKDRLSFVVGDLTSLPTVLEVFDRYRPTTVFHLGALLSAGAESSPHLGYQVDLAGTQNVLEAARIFGGPDEERVKVLFPSTIASFGTHLPPDKDGKKPLVPNEFVQMPTTMYGVAKVSSERLGEYYTRKGWVDFRAVRFPSIIGAGRGPGGTTVYSTLIIEKPALGENYAAYVYPDTRIAILYVKDAVSALISLSKADESTFGLSQVNGQESEADKRERILANRVYNIKGIVDESGQPPTAQAIFDALKSVKSSAGEFGKVTFDTRPASGDIAPIVKTLNSFGFLDDQLAQRDWGWKLQYDLNKAVDDFVREVQDQRMRIKKLELWG